METMGECIYAWMNAEDITVSRFAEKLGYKSKTSLFRLLHGKSNYQSYVQFCEVLAPYLDDGWKNRFHQALLTEKYGKRRHALLKEMNCCLFGNGDMKTDASQIKASSIFSGVGTVTILGCVWPGVFHFIDELLAAKEGPQVIHYFTHRDLFDSSCLLPGLISHMVCMNYSAMLLDETALYGAHVPWNIVLWINENKAHILFINNKEKYAWQPLSGGAAQAQHIIGALNTLPQTALYRYDHLQTGKDYIAFTEQSYRMEYKRKTLILKPTPGMQMLPADIVEHSFIDYLAERIEPLSAARNTLIYIYEKRVQNFYSHIKPTYLVFSLEAMLRFARDGFLDDQFFACRPFAETERIEVFRTLQSFSKNENVFVSFLDQPNWPISVEAYDGVGVLFYPSSSDYHTANSVYDNGCCLPEDRPCYVISPVYKTIHDGAVNCDYFLRAVLPLQPELNTAVWHALLREEDQADEGWKECVRCHKHFIPGSNRQRYCADCGAAAKQARNREKQRRHRERQKTPA